MTDQIIFDNEQKIHLMPPEQQAEADKIVLSSDQYRQSLENFQTKSTDVIKQIEELAQQTEQKRKRALGVRSFNNAGELRNDYNQSLARAKLSAAVFGLESVKMEVQGFECYKDVVKQTKTALVEIFGSQ